MVEIRRVLEIEDALHAIARPMRAVRGALYMPKLRSDQTDSVSIDLHQRRLDADGVPFSFDHACGPLRSPKRRAAMQESWDTAGSRPTAAVRSRRENFP